ncbi:TMV resistance protein N, partial [Mucuna pruriens]
MEQGVDFVILQQIVLGILRFLVMTVSASFSYDVFLSFRGSDTRYGFTGNLYKALCDRGIHTFIDHEELQRGDEIGPALIHAIKHSRMAILVFSKNYASSSFCLDELVKIIECVKAKGRFILPVFYDVHPSHMRHHNGSFGEALALHKERFIASKEYLKENLERLLKWKMALNQAANVSGKHYKLGKEYEHEFIEKIVKEVSNKINRTPLHVADYPVGLECRVQKVKSLLEFESDVGVHIVGIYGIGGMGKTTLARAVYNSIADQFEGLCFLDDVRESAIKHGLVHLQEMLLSEIVGEKDMKIGSVSKGISIIKHRLQRKKVLLILDDVDKLEQLRATVGVGGPNWFGSGSRIIITTRDKHLLASHGVTRKYEVEGLNEEEALELLSWNAFKDDKVDPSYKGISNQAVAYASGLPLALEVVGSLLLGKSIKEWESALDQYKKIPNKRIQDILKVSYNALEEDQQKIFLDIACCLKGYELAEVEDILRAHHGVCMKYGIGVLIDKSLVKIKNGCVTLHELIEVMGKEIDRQESPNELGKHRRLWFHKDIIQVLAENTVSKTDMDDSGSSEIEIINLDFPLLEEDEEVFVEWDGEAFTKMQNLKTLIIRNSHFSKGPTHLPNSLRVLEWWTYPLQDLPTDFHPNKLAICKLPRSCFTSLQLAGLSKASNFMNLTVLNFDETECLTQIPDISSLQNLVKLTFECCENLVAIHDSVGFLDKLKRLSAFGCSKLMSFPPIKLTSLEQLDLSSCSSLESFPEILGKMENITQLELKYTPIREFPFSFRNLARLQDLVLVDCGSVKLPSSIVMLPELAEIFALGCKGWLLPKQDEDEEKVSSMSSNVKCLCLSGCNLSDDYFPMVLAWFGNVKELELSSNNFTFLPECIKECHSLTLLNLDNCERLQEIRGIPPNLEFFSAGNCKSLSFCCSAMLLNQELHEAGNTMFCLPGARIPEWFEQQSIGPLLSFWFRNKFPVMDFCFVIGPMDKDSILFRPIMTINGNTVEIQFLTEKRFCFDFPALDDHILIIGTKYIKFGDNMDKVLSKNEWNHVVVSIGIDFEPSPKEMIVKQSGLHVIKPKSSMDDIQFTDPYSQPSFKEKHRLVDIADCHRQFMQQQITLVSLKPPHVGQGTESLSLLSPQACKNNMNWDSNSTGISSTASVHGYEIASQNLRLDMGVLQFVQQRKRLAILGLLQQRRMASLGLLQRRGRELLSLHSSPSLNLMVAWQRRCITSVQRLQEQHLPSTIKQNFEGCNKVKEMVECNSNYGNDNSSNLLVEQLPMTKIFERLSDQNF